MRDRGKSMEIASSSSSNVINNNNFISDFSDMPCKKHPSISPVGICPQCLKDRLINLVCSECGEQRLSSCSCSDDVSSSARISFLLENEKATKPKKEVIVLQRSNSNRIEIKKSVTGFWKIKRLFKQSKQSSYSEDNDQQMLNEMCVSRSRSLCSFRDESSDQFRFSSAKISDVTGGLLFDSSEEPRKSGFRGVFPIKESDFSAMDESAFIDLKLDLLSSSSMRLSNASDHENSAYSAGNGNGIQFGSCRITGNLNEFDRGIKRSSGKGNRVWKWISRQSSGRRSTSSSSSTAHKKDEKYYY